MVHTVFGFGSYSGSLLLPLLCFFYCTEFCLVHVSVSLFFRYFSYCCCFANCISAEKSIQPATGCLFECHIIDSAFHRQCKMKILLMPSSFKCFEFNLPYQMATSFYEFPNKFHSSSSSVFSLFAHTHMLLLLYAREIFIFGRPNHLFVCTNLCMLVSLPLFHFTFSVVVVAAAGFFRLSHSFVSYFKCIFGFNVVDAAHKLAPWKWTRITGKNEMIAYTQHI